MSKLYEKVGLIITTNLNFAFGSVAEILAQFPQQLSSNDLAYIGLEVW
jgi:hypothetical protein